mgnify:CR=1 FL=1
MRCNAAILYYSERTDQHPVVRVDDRVRIKYDYAGNTGTVTETGVLGVVVQWDGSNVEEWYYYEELELIEYE